MGELLALLLVLGMLIGVLMLMIPGMRPSKGPARTLTALNDYGEGSAWGIALIAGFAVYELIYFAAGLITQESNASFLVFLGLFVCLGVGASCGVGGGPNRLLELPASLVGALAAVVTSGQIFVSSWQNPSRAYGVGLIVITALLGLLFIMFMIVRGPGRLRGLAWFTALEAVLLFVSPFGTDLLAASISHWAIGLVIGIVAVIALALLPWVMLNLLAVGVVIADGLMVFMGYGGFAVWFFAGAAWLGYAAGRRFLRFWR